MNRDNANSGAQRDAQVDPDAWKLDRPDAYPGEDQAEAGEVPPRPGSNEALNAERRTPPSRNRGVTDV